MTTTSQTKWGIWVNHTDGSRVLFYAPSFALAKRDGDRYLANPATASVDIGPWDGPGSAGTYHRAKLDERWRPLLGQRGRIAAKVRVKIS